MDRLVNELSAQLVKINSVYEIILIDDASVSQFRNQYESLPVNVKYIQREQNTGRAAIRNLFLNYAQYGYLLFLDCDSIVVKPDFISCYLNAISSYPDSVLCGGRIYPDSRPGREKQLNWQYGKQVESKSAAERSKNPYTSFMTNNFVVPRKILESIRFDERINKYGHEDTLWGIELRRNNKVDVVHIDNPVLNDGIEDNKEFLNKTRDAIRNLVFIDKVYASDKELHNSISLLKFYNKFRFASGFINVLYIISSPLIIALLKRGIVNLKLFSFYKLGFFIHLKLKKR